MKVPPASPVCIFASSWGGCTQESGGKTLLRQAGRQAGRQADRQTERGRAVCGGVSDG